MNWRVHFWNHRPSIQGITGPLRVEYTASGTCTCEGTGNVQSRTAGVQRCHLRQIVSYGLVNWRVRFRNHTPSIQGATGPHTFVFIASGTCTCEGIGSVHSRTAGVQRCHLRKNASHGLVNWRVHFRNRKLSVQGTTGPPIFAYTAIFSPLDPVPRNVEPYKVCTNIPVVPECFPWPSELAFAFSKS